MSIEQALAENTAALKHLAAVMASGVAASAASTTPAPPPAKPKAAPAETKTEPKPATLDYDKDVVPALKAVAASKEPGRGRDGLVSLLKKYLPGDDKPDATKLKPLVDKFSAIIADAKTLLDTGALPGAAAPAADDLGLG